MITRKTPRLLTALLTLICLGASPFATAKNEAFCSPQVLAKKIPKGYTWTLSSRMGALLMDAEKRYGKPNPDWTLLGVYFTKDPAPSIWYPFSGRGQKMIGIMLTEGAADNQKETMLQLAHEVIHVLSPIGPGRDSTVFEEGLASWFSVQAPKKLGVFFDEHYMASSKYRAAYYAVEKLYKLHPDSDQRIRKLRTRVASFTDLDPGMLRKAFPNVSNSHIRTLLTSFSKWDHTSRPSP